MWSEWKASIRTHTQQDPIGLAGGLNLYGFAGGDPINFSDPFGLCREGAYDDCQWLVEQLRGVGNRFFNSIAYMCESGDFEVHLTDATDKKLDPFGANRDDDPSNTVLGSTSPGGTVRLNADVGKGDLIYAAAHEAWMHVNLGGLDSDGVKPETRGHAAWAEWQNPRVFLRWNRAIFKHLPAVLQQSAPHAASIVGVSR